MSPIEAGSATCPERRGASAASGVPSCICAGQSAHRFSASQVTSQEPQAQQNLCRHIGSRWPECESTVGASSRRRRVGIPCGVVYDVVKLVLSPLLRSVLPGPSHGSREHSQRPGRDHRLEPPGVLRLAVHPARRPAPGDFRGQGGLLQELEDAVVLPCHRPDPDGAGRRQGLDAIAQRGARVAASRRGARDLPGGHALRRTSVCTEGAPASPVSSWRRGCPVVPVGIRGTREVQPIGKTDADAVQDGGDPFRRADRLLCPLR